MDGRLDGARLDARSYLDGGHSLEAGAQTAIEEATKASEMGEPKTRRTKLAAELVELLAFASIAE